MKAVVYRQYGPPDMLRLEEVETPVPNDDQVLIKVKAVSINGSDWEGLRGKPLYARMGGLLRPSAHILGSDVSGLVERVGRNIQEFKTGDEVFGETMTYNGGFAEYVCVPEKALAIKPAWMTFEQAAAIPQGSGIALKGIREKGQVKAGQQVLINGAGGSAGIFAVQFAKNYGAEVTGVDNAGKLDFLRTLGADHVIDYHQVDFTRDGRQYDLILDIIAQRPVLAYPRALKAGGKYFAVGGSVGVLLQILALGPWIRRRTGKSVRILVVQPNRKDLLEVIEFVHSGKVVPVIDKVFPLAAVPEAMRYAGEGHAKGKVVIAVG